MLQQPRPQDLLESLQRRQHRFLLPPACSVLCILNVALQPCQKGLDQFLAELGQDVHRVDATAVSKGNLGVEHGGQWLIFAYLSDLGEPLDRYRDGSAVCLVVILGVGWGGFLALFGFRCCLFRWLGFGLLLLGGTRNLLSASPFRGGFRFLGFINRRWSCEAPSWSFLGCQAPSRFFIVDFLCHLGFLGLFGLLGLFHNRFFLRFLRASELKIRLLLRIGLEPRL